MSVGMLGYFGVGVESSFGQNSNTPGDYVPILSETLAIQRTDLEMQGITAKWDSQQMVAGLQRVSGSVAMEVHPSAFGHFLRIVLDTHTSIPSHAVCTSNANWKAHIFQAAQAQFQSGSGSDLPTMTGHVYRGPLPSAAAAPSSAFAYMNMAGNAMEMTVQAGQLTNATFDMVGRDYARVPAVTPVFPTPGTFIWTTASLAIGGVGQTVFDALTFRVNNNLEDVPKLDGRLRPDLIKRNALRTVEVNGSLTFQNDTDYDNFTQGSERNLQLFFQSGSFGLLIQAPSFRYLTYPLGIPGPGRLSIQFTGRAMYNTGSATAFTVTLVNTRLNLYHSNTSA